MLLTVSAGPYTIRGVSVGGVYTSLYVQQLGALLDVGVAPRSFAGTGHVFVTHGHADHIGALGALLGIRALSRLPPPRAYFPAELATDVRDALAALSRLQGFDLAIEAMAVEPGSEHELRRDLSVRVFAVPHVVPAVGYQFFSRVDKLRPEFTSLPGPEIAQRRAVGEALFDTVERLELAYVTDTLASIFETQPSLLKTRVLITECTFLDDRKPRAKAQASGHLHLDDLLDRASLFENEALVLMHISQLYSPAEARAVIRQRCPAALRERIVVFAPDWGAWPG